MQETDEPLNYNLLAFLFVVVYETVEELEGENDMKSNASSSETSSPSPFVRGKFIDGVDHYVNPELTDRPWPCKYCEKKFQNKTNLSRHERLHTGERPFQCGVCPKGFVEKYELMRHMSKKHKASPELIERMKKEIKPATIKPVTVKAEVIHMENLPPEKITSIGPPKSAGDYKCKICGRSFPSLTNLKRHENLHTGEKVFSCKFCKKTFYEKYDVKRHIMRKHKIAKDDIEPNDIVCDNEKVSFKFNCKFCQKGFDSRGNWRRHEKVHLNDRQYLCIVCNKAYIEQYEVKRHMFRRHKQDYENVKNGMYHKMKTNDLRELDVDVLNSDSDDYSKEDTMDTDTVDNSKMDSSEADDEEFAALEKAMNFDQGFVTTYKTEPADELPSVTEGFTLVDKDALVENTKRKNPIVIDSSTPPGTSFRSAIKDSCKHCGKGFKYLSYLERHVCPEALNVNTERDPLAIDDKDGEDKTFENTPKINSELQESDSSLSVRSSIKGRCKFCGKGFKYLSNLEKHECATTDPRTVNSNDTACKEPRDEIMNDSEDEFEEPPVVAIYDSDPESESEAIRKSLEDSDDSDDDDDEEMNFVKKEPLDVGGNDSDVDMEDPDVTVKKIEDSLENSEPKSPKNVETASVNSESQQSESENETERKLFNHEVSEYMKNIFKYTVTEPATNNRYSIKSACRYCGKKYKYLAHLEKHKCLESGGKNIDVNTDAVNEIDEVPENPDIFRHSCEHCGKSYQFLSYLKRHLKVCPKLFKKALMKKGAVAEESESDEEGNILDTNNPYYSCNFCEKKFQGVEDIKKHMQGHLQDPYRFSCKVCAVKFLRKVDLENHESKYHPEDKRLIQYKCGSCGKMFSKAIDLEEHTYEHTGRPPYNCRVCSLQFWKFELLKRHESEAHDPGKIVEKSGEKKVLKWPKMAKVELSPTQKEFACKSCDKTFYTESALNRHEKSHSGKPAYSCRLCEETFDDYPDAQKHEAVHVTAIAKDFPGYLCESLIIKND